MFTIEVVCYLIRSVELGVCPMQLFHFWSRDVHPVQNLLLCTKFHQNRLIFHRYGDISIFKMAAVRHLGIVLPPTRPPTKSLLLAAAACQIPCQSETQIWMYSYLNFSHIWLEMPIQAPKMGVWGTLDLQMWLFIIETPKKHILA